MRDSNQIREDKDIGLTMEVSWRENQIRQYHRPRPFLYILNDYLL